MKARARIRDLAARLWREHATPRRLGVAVGLGVVVGCSPFFGLHFWIGLGLAALLRLNKIAVFLGSQISIPPVAPLLGFASVQVGAMLLTGEAALLDVDDFTLARLPGLLRGFLSAWLVGGLVIGIGLAVPACAITALVVDRRRRGDESPAVEEDDGDEWRRVLSRAAELYGGAPPKHRYYATFKYRMDPVYRQVGELVLPGRGVVDLGTGLGMLPAVLALRGEGEILGVDWDREKIDSGRIACAELDAVRLERADVRAFQIPEAGTIVLADVLHYWPLEEQRALLQRAAAALAPGGRLIIRETDRLGRSWLTRSFEWIAVKTGWNRGPGLIYATEPELREELEGLGLSCAATPASSKIHRGNVLIWGERR